MKPHGCQDMTAIEVAEALQLYLDGVAVKEIAAEYGRHPNTIRKIAKQAGLTRRRPYYRGPRAYLVDRLHKSYPYVGHVTPEMHP